MLGDAPVLVAKAIAICETLRTASDHFIDNIVIESNSQLVIDSIRGLIKVPINHVADIVSLARNFDDIQFSYCNRSQNFLADRIAERSHYTCNAVPLYQ